jgi:hypothetical protein
MPFLDPFNNDQYMRKWMVYPREATAEDLAGFIDPYIITHMIRGESQVTLMWYSGTYDEGTFRGRADEWERLERSRSTLPKGREEWDT